MSKIDDAFVEASAKGKVNDMERLLAAGADINHKYEKDREFLGIFLDYPRRHHTALITAVERRNHQIVRFLLEKQADTEMETAYRYTALHRAVQDAGKGEEFIDLLLAHGANVNAQNEDGYTALHMAIFAGDRDSRDRYALVEKLLHAGADPLLECSWCRRKWNAKAYAGQYNYGDIVNLIDGHIKKIEAQKHEKGVECLRQLPRGQGGQTLTEMHRTLVAKTTPLTLEHFRRVCAETGEPYLLISARLGFFPQLSALMKMNGERMSAEDLTVAGRKGENLVSILGARGELGLVFQPQDWLDRIEELKTVEQAIVPEYREQAGIYLVLSRAALQKMKSSRHNAKTLG